MEGKGRRTGRAMLGRAEWDGFSLRGDWFSSVRKWGMCMEVWGRMSQAGDRGGSAMREAPEE